MKFCFVHFNNMLRSMTSCLSAVFNSLVLLCIREIDGALQKILNIKMDKDQKKYRTIIGILHLLTCILFISLFYCPFPLVLGWCFRHQVQGGRRIRLTLKCISVELFRFGFLFWCSFKRNNAVSDRIIFPFINLTFKVPTCWPDFASLPP